MVHVPSSTRNAPTQVATTKETRRNMKLNEAVKARIDKMNHDEIKGAILCYDHIFDQSEHNRSKGIEDCYVQAERDVLAYLEKRVMMMVKRNQKAYERITRFKA